MSAEKTVIIGAGASGLAAAVIQARMGRSVTVLEHRDRAGIKLSITGNGKCNFTNAYMTPSCFHESRTSRLNELLGRFTTEDAIDFIKSLGIGICSKDGYYYPETLKAGDVTEALVKECESLGAVIRYGVTDIDIDSIRQDSDRVILACGSRAHKETGSNGTGYKYLERLGISYTRILPALCALYCEDDGFFRDNRGKRAIGAVSIDGQTAAGELQITDYGLSGIPVFNISRYASILLDGGQKVSVTVNFDPKEDMIPEIVRNRSGSNVYKPIVGDRIKTFIVRKTASFDRSQICTGGVSLDDLSDDFEVRKVPGVYVIGEMCDVDGICGGYNLHWAWLSACLCAK